MVSGRDWRHGARARKGSTVAPDDDRPSPQPAGPDDAKALGPVDDDLEPMSFKRRTARILALLAGALIVGMWLYAFFGPIPHRAPGVLSDRSFPEAAVPICTQAADVIAALPPAYSTSDPAQRAAVISQANSALTEMLDRLSTVAPTPGTSKDADMIAEWLGDWRTYVGDRQRFAETLASDPKARLFVTTKENQQITKPIDFFANINHMLECSTPTDVI